MKQILFLLLVGTSVTACNVHEDYYFDTPYGYEATPVRKHRHYRHIRPAPPVYKPYYAPNPYHRHAPRYRPPSGYPADRGYQIQPGYPAERGYQAQPGYPADQGYQAY